MFLCHPKHINLVLFFEKYRTTVLTQVLRVGRSISTGNSRACSPSSITNYRLLGRWRLLYQHQFATALRSYHIDHDDVIPSANFGGGVNRRVLFAIGSGLWPFVLPKSQDSWYAIGVHGHGLLRMRAFVG